jgi:hypothetical protein
MAKATTQDSGTQSAEGPLAPPVPPLRRNPADDRSEQSPDRTREAMMHTSKTVQVPIPVVAPEQLVTTIS